MNSRGTASLGVSPTEATTFTVVAFRPGASAEGVRRRSPETTTAPFMFVRQVGPRSAARGGSGDETVSQAGASATVKVMSPLPWFWTMAAQPTVTLTGTAVGPV